MKTIQLPKESRKDYFGTISFGPFFSMENWVTKVIQILKCLYRNKLLLGLTRISCRSKLVMGDPSFNKNSELDWMLKVMQWLWSISISVYLLLLMMRVNKSICLYEATIANGYLFQICANFCQSGFSLFLAAKKIIGKFKDIEIDICPWLFLTVSLQMRRGNYEMH